jgi:glycosyltransferase involved in cell wall biosynthesis
MPRVSIIVPVYNVYEYIDKCIESLVNQTFKDIEIIIINDGSTDKVEEKLIQWSKIDNRIIIINNEKRGAAFSRNCGIKIASGEYLSFVDSDDYCHSEMIERLYNALFQNDADYVFCDYFRTYPDGKIDSCRLNIDLIQPTALKYRKELLFKVDPNIWNKLYKKSLLIDNHIRFNDKVLKCHDVPFTTSVLTAAAKIVQVKESLYYYRVNRPDSITAQFNKRSFEWQDAWPTTVEFFQEHNIFHYYCNELEKRLIDSCLYLVKQVMYNSNNIELIECAINGHLNYLDKYFPRWRENKYFDGNNESTYRKINLYRNIRQNRLSEKPVIIFSASIGGKNILSFLNSFGIIPNCICDNSTDKQNTFINGIKIISPKNIIESFGKDVILIVASDYYFTEIKEQMLELGISDDNIF